MSSKTFKIILAGDAKGASTAVKDAQKAGDNLISASSGWSGKWSSSFGAMGQKLADFGQKLGAADGWKAKLSVLGDSGGAALSGLGDKFTGLATTAAAGAAGVALALVALAPQVWTKVQEIGGYLFNLGEEFYVATGKLRTGTGETGAALDGLKDSFYGVYIQTTRSKDEIAAAMTMIEQKLEHQGKPLEDLSLGFIRLSNATSSDLMGNISSLAPVFEQFNLTADEQTLAMDELFRAWQETGILPAEMASQLQTAAPALKDLNYSWGDSLSLVAQFADEGVNASTILGSFTIALRGMAKESATTADKQEKVIELEGKYAEAVAKGAEGADEAARIQKKLADARKDLASAIDSTDIRGEFMGTIDAIKAAGSDAEANEIAVGKFGRAAIGVADAVRSGAFDIDAMYDSIVNGKDTLKDAAKDTGTFRSSLTLLSHMMEETFAPIAETVFGGFNTLIRENLMPLAKGLHTAWKEDGWEGVLAYIPVAWGLIKIKLSETVGGVKAWFAAEWPGIWAKIEEGASTAWEGIKGWFTDHAPEIADAFGKVNEWILDKLGDLNLLAYEKLAEFLPALGSWFTETAWPFIETHWQEILSKFVGVIGPLAGKIIQGMWTVFWAVGEWFVNDLGPWALETGDKLWQTWLDYIFSGRMVSDIGGGIGGIVEWLETDGVSLLGAAASSLWNALSEPFYPVINAIIRAWDSLDFSMHVDLPGWMNDRGFSDVNIDDVIPDIGQLLTSDQSAQYGAMVNPGWGGSKESIPNFKGIPGLATGAVITRPTLAWVGEDSRTTPEIVSPVETIKDAVREVMREGGLGGGQTIVQLVWRDGRVLADVMVESLRTRGMTIS